MEIIKGGTKHILFPYQLRPLQKETIEKMGRFCLLVAHRRFGKTMMVLLHIIFSAMLCKLRNPKFWYICPLEKQARNNAWDYLKSFSSYLPNGETNEGRLELTFDLNDGVGTRTIALKGVDKGGDSLRGSYLDGVVLDEMKDMPIKAWTQIISPMLADRKGWAVLTGTAGQGPWYELFMKEQNDPDSQFKCFTYKASETKIIDDKELERLRKQMGDRNFRRELECDWSAIDEGSYYGDIIAGLEDMGQINLEIKHNPHKPVYTSWDLGASDATAVWFFQEGEKANTWNVIDYLQMNRWEYQEQGFSTQGKSFDIIMYDMILKKPYLYAAHVLPHDSRQKHRSAEYSTYEKFKEASGNADIIVAAKTTVLARIETVQHMLNLFHFNKLNCVRGISALQSYKSKLSSDGVELTEDHNWASHGADSFGYFCHSIPLLSRVQRKYNKDKFKNTPKQIDSYNPLK